MTVCPPKDSNTALYHDLAKAGHEPLSHEHREALKKSAFEIFFEATHKDYAKKMIAASNIRNMDQVYHGFYSLPKPYKHENGFEIKMWNWNGTITTPWFGEEFNEEYYKEDRDFHMMLELPDDINDQVGSGSLIIDLEFNTRK